MAGPGRAREWIALAALVATVLALAVSGTASGSPTGGGAAAPAPSSCAAPILPCYIVVSIGSGSHGNNETVTGVRFWPGEPFTVYFWNGTVGDSAALIALGTTSYSGSFTVSFRVPREAVGNYTIFADDLAGDNQSAPFHMTNLRASPDSAPAGNTTLVSGQGFLPDHLVKFRLHGAQASPVARCRTDLHGKFTDCRVTVPSVGTGRTQLVATDGTYTARLEFVVS
jgi:hypothetical protein